MGSSSVLPRAATRGRPHWIVACLIFGVLSAGCSGGGDTPSADRGRSAPQTVAVGGDFAGAVSGLCLAYQQASTDLRTAKATYQGRARNGVEITTRALQGSYSILASRLAEAAAAVEADLAPDPPRPTLGRAMGRLIERMREGVARLGIPTSACEK